MLSLALRSSVYPTLSSDARALIVRQAPQGHSLPGALFHLEQRPRGRDAGSGFR